MTRSLRTRLLILGALVTMPALRACKDSTSVELLAINATGGVVGKAFLDNNGNGVLDAQDPPLSRVPVVLTVAKGGQVVERVESDTAGLFAFAGVPVGSYRLALDAGALGDSLKALGSGPELAITRDSTTLANLAVSYPVLPLDSVRASPAGRKVFTSGIALNPRQSFGDGVVHIQADTLYLRATNVARANLTTGDSVRLLGRVKIDNGEPVLDNVTPFVLVSLATVPIPLDVSTLQAATAKDGHIDAALVRIRNGEISDTSTVDGSFHFYVDDGSGRAEVVLRSFLQLNTSVIRPDSVFRAQQITGLLTPVQDATGGVRWSILPRAGADVVIEQKVADVGLTLTADKATAKKGDRVRFTVVATNAGPVGASGVQVTDSVPQGLTFATATATRGSYDAASGIWTLDSLKVGAADTLKIDADVTTSAVGQTVDHAFISKHLRESDLNATNNSVFVALVIVAAEQLDEAPPRPKDRK